MVAPLYKHSRKTQLDQALHSAIAALKSQEFNPFRFRLLKFTKIMTLYTREIAACNAVFRLSIFYFFFRKHSKSKSNDSKIVSNFRLLLRCQFEKL